MRSQISTPRRRIAAHVMTALFVLAGTSATFADIWTYQVVGNTFQPSGRVSAPGNHIAIACSPVLQLVHPV